ncbi:MAG: hypothetical protein ACJAYG_000604 [Oceanicoccus sp.]|jgi:hypothetical protein
MSLICKSSAMAAMADKSVTHTTLVKGGKHG